MGIGFTLGILSLDEIKFLGFWFKNSFFHWEGARRRRISIASLREKIFVSRKGARTPGKTPVLFTTKSTADMVDS